MFLLTLESPPIRAQEKDYEALDVSPQPIRQGITVRLKLKVEKTELDSATGEVYAIMIAYRIGEARIYDTLMHSDKKTLAARFRIPAGTDAVAFKFMRRNQQAVNNGHGYFFSVADSAGNPQTNSYYSLYRLQSNEFQSGITKGNATLAKRYFDKWFEQQDQDKFSYYDRALYLYIRKDTAGLCQHLSQIKSVPDIAEGKLQNLQIYARPCGQAMIQSMIMEQQRRFPDGNWYWRGWSDSMRVLKTTEEKFAWIKAFRMAFPKDSQREYPVADGLFFQIMNASTRSLDWEAMRKAAAQVEAGQLLNERFHSIFNAFMDEALRRDTLMQELVPRARQLHLIARQQYYTPAQVPEGRSSYLLMLEKKKIFFNSASIYGSILHRTGQTDSASQLTEMAARFYDWRSPVYNERFFESAEHSRPAGELIPLMEQAFRSESYTRAMKEMYVRVYNRTGRGDGFAALEALLAERRKKLFAELRERMKSDPAPEFELPGLNSGSASLASLRGKVVLIDFWATWCGPCIASFPTMKELVIQNKNRSDVAILFVDTWQKEADKYATVRQFFRENPYPFDVYMDNKDEVVKNFKVTGIPTKIVIDKKGIIRFVSVGFVLEDQKGVEELQAMIDLAALM
ncbi:MAG: TlpA family protein disulfide reductase [Chitinophagaceae bacterium]